MSRPFWGTRAQVVKLSILFAVAFWSVRGVAIAQVVNPATAQPTQPPPKPEERLHTWEMPPVTVYGKAPMVEEDRIGDYEQPRWTTHRRFGETRVYVIPKGMIDFEYWLIPKTPKDGEPTDTASQFEIEFGLPGRIQVDLYAVAHKEGIDGPFNVSEQKMEFRWALADWGKIPGNPTIYLEWKNENAAPDHVEAKLLLGGEITSGWHWGSNLVWEHELGGPQENSNEWTTGISRTIRDSKASVGVETQLALVNTLDGHGKRGDFEKEFLIGPSIQIRPLPQMHIDFAPLFGTTKAAARSKVFVVLGWEF